MLHLDYGISLYEEAFNNSFHDILESLQYKVFLIITGAIRGTSGEKLDQELGLAPLGLPRWYRKLCLFYTDFKNEHPQCIFHLIPVRRFTQNSHFHSTQHSHFQRTTWFFEKTLSFHLLSQNRINLT